MYDGLFLQLFVGTGNIATRRGPLFGFRSQDHPIVTATPSTETVDELQARVARLEKRVQRLRAIRAVRLAMLRIAKLDLSPSRLSSWRGSARACDLDDAPSCPSASPQRLTAAEVSTIQELVTSTEFRHVPTGRLSVLAQRLGRVFASTTTWYLLVKEHGWRRPRLRQHPIDLLRRVALPCHDSPSLGSTIVFQELEASQEGRSLMRN